jgi:hypothetical protein
MKTTRAARLHRMSARIAYLSSLETAQSHDRERALDVYGAGHPRSIAAGRRLAATQYAHRALARAHRNASGRV